MDDTMRCTTRYDDDAIEERGRTVYDEGRRTMTKIDEAVRNCAIDSKDD